MGGCEKQRSSMPRVCGPGCLITLLRGQIRPRLVTGVARGRERERMRRGSDVCFAPEKREGFEGSLVQ